MLQIRLSDWAQIERGVPQSDASVHVAPSLTAAEITFRDPVSLAVDLLRLERHYRSEAERLQAEASDARRAARECRQWAANLQRTAAK